MNDAFDNFEPELAWDESFYDYVEQIERGVEPVAIPFQVALGFDGRRPRVLGMRRGRGETSAPPHRCVLNVTYQLTRARLCEIVLEQIADCRQQGKSPLPALALLARVDRERLLELAAAYFIERGEVDRRTPDENDALGTFIVDLHERDAALLVEIVRAALAKNPAGGAQFRERLLDALQEPALRDELGMLAAMALAEELEALPA